VSAEFRSFVEDSDDLDQSRLNRPIVEHIRPGREFISSLGKRAFGLSSNHSHRGGEKNSVPAPGSQPFGACCQNIREIGLPNRGVHTDGTVV
jgi:hypothetical protein